MISLTDFQIPRSMKALVASGKGFANLRVTDVPVPEVSPGQLLARVDAAGVCTSILKLIEQGENHIFLNGWDLVKWPIILGDEGSVTVVKVGEHLKDRYKPGQRFGIQPAVDLPPILHRERYRNNGKGMAKCAVGYTLGGNLAEYIRIQEEVLEAGCLIPLPDEEMAYFEVSMAEPISCVYSAQQRHYHFVKDNPFEERKGLMGLLPGGIAVIFGAGVMGRMHAELALRFSPRILIVTDLLKNRLEKVKKYIANKARKKGIELICITADKLEETVTNVSDCRGIDDIILAVGDQQVQQDALCLLARDGVANLFGGLSKGKHILNLNALDVHYHEIKIVGSSGGDPNDLSAALKAITNQDIDAGNYVACVGSLENSISILNLMKEANLDGRAILYPHLKGMPFQKVESWDKDKEQRYLNRPFSFPA